MKLLRRRYQGILRAATVGISVILQVIFLVLMAEVFKEYSSWVYILLQIFSICLVFFLVNNGESYQLFWIIIVLVLPVFGFLLYFMWGRKHTNSKLHKRIRAVQTKSRQFKKQDEHIIEEFKEKHPNKAQVSTRLIKEGFMLYNHTKVTYFDVGEKKFESLYEDMELSLIHI